MKPDPTDTTVEILRNKPVPSLRWRHYTLTAEMARAWGAQLLQAAYDAEVAWNNEEAVRDSKREHR